MENEFKVLGRRVKALRINKGITQTKMAELLGLSQTNLSNMESGRTAITTQNLFKMQGILNCKMADFFVDFDVDAEEAATAKSEGAGKQAIELEDAVQILRLLKAVEIKGV
ncbi:MAG: helix-turn-helix transcriptional regulator [Phascolarctobacterium sp.]|nr:helix-turn-helix transcriptional regulator [Phascolarctobacterium sp.]